MTTSIETPKSRPERVENFNLAVGHWLKAARKAKGLSVREAAIEIQSTKKTIIEIEAGIQSITGSDFYGLINAYEIPLSDVNEFLHDFGLAASPS